MAIGREGVPLLGPRSLRGRVGDQVESIFEKRLDVEFHPCDTVDRGGAVGDDGHVELATDDSHNAVHRECQPADRQSMRDQLIFLRPHLTLHSQPFVTDAKLNELFSPPSKESP